mmetsp:Transcript_44634/g.123699  ORF Transcript_44634/g.123699 Transcript_44634/m.123699 type:complete len:234 (+) Transcript_44634:299-1000(+)
MARSPLDFSALSAKSNLATDDRGKARASCCRSSNNNPHASRLSTSNRGKPRTSPASDRPAPARPLKDNRNARKENSALGKAARGALGAAPAPALVRLIAEKSSAATGGTKAFTAWFIADTATAERPQLDIPSSDKPLALLASRVLSISAASSPRPMQPCRSSTFKRPADGRNAASSTLQRPPALSSVQLTKANTPTAVLVPKRWMPAINAPTSASVTQPSNSKRRSPDFLLRR